jgi:hypothetical protein
MRQSPSSFRHWFEFVPASVRVRLGTARVRSGFNSSSFRHGSSSFRLQFEFVPARLEFVPAKFEFVPASVRVRSCTGLGRSGGVDRASRIMHPLNIAFTRSIVIDSGQDDPVGATVSSTRRTRCWPERLARSEFVIERRSLGVPLFIIVGRPEWILRSRPERQPGRKTATTGPRDRSPIQIACRQA